MFLDEVGEHHEVVDEDFVHAPNRLERMQIVLGRLRVDVIRFAGKESRGRMDLFTPLVEQPRQRRLGKPVHLQPGAQRSQLVGDGKIATRVAKADR